MKGLWVRVALLLALLAPLGVRLVGPVAAAEDVETAIRLLVVDAKTNMLHVVNGKNGEVIASFSTPGPASVYAASEGRYFFAVHRAANRVTIVDSGIRTVDHGDHKDLIVGPAYVRATVNTGRLPTHYFSHHGMIGIINDGDPTLSIFDEKRLELSVEPLELRTARAGHNAPVIWGDLALVGYIETGTVDVYRMNGTLVQTFEGCPALHGEALAGDLVAFGCADGVLLIARTPAGLVAKKINEPAGSLESERVGTVVAHENASVMIGNFGQGLAIIRPNADTFEKAPLPANPLKFAFLDGEHVVVLTADGTTHVIEAATGRVKSSITTVAPFVAAPSGQPAPPRPSMALGGGLAYVTDPTIGEIVVVDLKAATVTRRFKVGGAPTSIAILMATGVVH